MKVINKFNEEMAKKSDEWITDKLYFKCDSCGKIKKVKQATIISKYSMPSNILDGTGAIICKICEKKQSTNTISNKKVGGK